MHIAVVIVGFRNPKDIQSCIAALAKNDYPDFEIVICENGGASAFAALRNVMPQALPSGQAIRLIEAPQNEGYAGGVNICIKASPDADAWWVLNPDTEPTPGAMSALVRRLEQGADAVGNPIYLSNGFVQSFGGLWRPWLGRSVSIGSGTPKSVDSASFDVEGRQNYLSGASMMVSRDFVKTAGLMHEDFFLYCEEVDWFLRAHSLGLRLGFAPDALVLHHQGTTTGYKKDLKSRSRLAVYLDERNKIRVTRKHFPLRLPVAASAAFLQILLRYGRRGAWRQFCYGLAGWWAGLRGERGKPSWVS